MVGADLQVSFPLVRPPHTGVAAARSPRFALLPVMRDALLAMCDDD